MLRRLQSLLSLGLFLALALPALAVDLGERAPELADACKKASDELGE